MNRFTVDFSSSPASQGLPSNSPQQQEQRSRSNVFSIQDDIASTTPAAPPPSQLFGSSHYGSGISKLQFTNRSDSFSSGPKFQPFNAVASNRYRADTFGASTNTYATEDDEEHDYTDAMVEDGDEDDEENQVPQSSGPVKSTAPSLLTFSTNSMQQSMRRTTQRRGSGGTRSRLPRKGRYDVIQGLARDIFRRTGLAKVTEPDEIILATEDLMRSFDDECQQCNDEQTLRPTISAASQELLSQWKRISRHKLSSGQNAVGPNGTASQFEKAQYIANLLLRLQNVEHPDRNSRSLVTSGSHHAIRPMPEILLDWLDAHHINYAPLFDQVINTTPAPSANELYWDAVETFTLRGRFEEVMELLRRGDLNYAVIDTPDGYKNAGFTGTQLQQAEDAVYRARQLINTCPAFQTGDWDLQSQDWDVYRKQLEAEISHLANNVGSPGAGDKNSLGLLGKTSGGAGLPFPVFQRLKTVYSIMLGDADEILGLAQDWLEASVFLTVWWIPTTESSVAKWSIDVGRANNALTDAPNPYLKRLSDAFLCVTDPDSESAFQMNTVNAVEVGLGAVLQGDIQACLQILQTLSLCAASSVAEIGAWSGWLASSSPGADLDQDDLMVLNYGSETTMIKKDDILEAYAKILFEQDKLHGSGGAEIEGWEFSFSVLSRMDDQERMHESISELLQNLSVTDQQRTAKLVDICEQFGLEAEGRKVSENFADSLVNNTTEYGTALLCYARAHAEQKVRQLIDVLNSYCLVQSQAYPPDNEMDPALRELVSSPRAALGNITNVDPQAAEVLQFYLVGYACLRRFYTLRDDRGGKTSQIGSLVRRKAAAKALIAAINSAADCIYGGLYDPGRQSAIQVDGLLTLLGEATALLDQADGRRILSSSQLYALLAAIEDLQTVSDRVYQAAEECLEAALRNYHGSLPPSPHAMLKKSISSGTNSNFSFSMMGSEMLSKSQDSLEDRSLGSAVMVDNDDGEKSQRSWDWRSKFKHPEVEGADVLKHLRFAIAKELSIATVEESGASS